MLDTVQHHTIGSTAVTMTVAGDVNDIGLRLAKGDATLGWEGDPALSLHLAVEIDARGEPVPNGQVAYEVWHVGADGEPYCVLSAQKCDERIIRRIAAADNRRTSLTNRVESLQNKIDAARASREADQRGALAEKLAWALRKDLGAHVDGLTRDIH